MPAAFTVSQRNANRAVLDVYQVFVNIPRFVFLAEFRLGRMPPQQIALQIQNDRRIRRDKFRTIQSIYPALLPELWISKFTPLPKSVFFRRG